VKYNPELNGILRIASVGDKGSNRKKEENIEINRSV